MSGAGAALAWVEGISVFWAVKERLMLTRLKTSALISCLMVAAACTAPTAGDGATRSRPGSDALQEGDEENAGEGVDPGSTLELGAVVPGTPTTIDVPADALGFSVAVVGDSGAFVGIESLVAPSGASVVSRYTPAGGSGTLALGSRGVGAFSVPMTDATATGRLEHGAWRLVVGGVVPDASSPSPKGTAAPTGAAVRSPLRVTVQFQRSGDGAFHGGALDLHIYVPEGLRIHDPDPVHVVSAEGASADASMNRRVSLFYTELSRLFGIGQGVVAYHRIDRRFATATSGDARAELMAQASVSAPHALHVVLTNELSYGGGGEGLLGYSVGMPGAANLPSSVRSSVAVAIYDNGTAMNDAITVLHEMGHFVGLMHSTEYDGTPDLLADTPTCPPPGKNCPDVNNLMAPDGPAKAALVSPSQIRVVRGSPIYRAIRAQR